MLTTNAVVQRTVASDFCTKHTFTYRYSQLRIRRRKRRTSLCFFFHNSSRYLHHSSIDNECYGPNFHLWIKIKKCTALLVRAHPKSTTKISLRKGFLLEAAGSSQPEVSTSVFLLFYVRVAHGTDRPQIPKYLFCLTSNKRGLATYCAGSTALLSFAYALVRLEATTVNTSHASTARRILSGTHRRADTVARIYALTIQHESTSITGYNVSRAYTSQRAAQVL